MYTHNAAAAAEQEGLTIAPKETYKMVMMHTNGVVKQRSCLCTYYAFLCGCCAVEPCLGIIHNAKTPPKAAWETVCLPKSEGGQEFTQNFQ